MADATDDFNRANGGLGANWTTLSGSPAIASNAWGSAAGQAIWTADSFDNDQYSEVTGLALTSGNGGPIVRGAANNFYFAFNSGSSDLAIWKCTGGSFTQLDGQALSLANSDVIRLEIIGTSLKAYQNGVERCSATDSDHTSGSPGILSNGGATYNSWLGGPIAGGGGGSSIPVLQHHYRMMKGRAPRHARHPLIGWGRRASGLIVPKKKAA